MISGNPILNNFSVFSSTEEIAPELKKEHELNTNDRMHLINKNIDEKIIDDIYNNEGAEGLLKLRNKTDL